MKSLYFTALLCSVIMTYILRALPFLLFTRRPMPKWMESLGSVLPAAIMAALLVYCLKDAGSDWVGIGLPKLAGVLITAGLYLWKEQTWLAIAGGTAGYLWLSAVL